MIERDNVNTGTETPKRISAGIYMFKANKRNTRTETLCVALVS